MEDATPTTRLCDYCQSEVPIKATRCRFCSSVLTKKSTEENDAFTIEREEAQEHLPNGFVETIERIWIIIKSDSLIQTLRIYMQDPKLFDKEPKLSLTELLTILPNLRQNKAQMGGWGGGPLILQLVEFLEKEHDEKAKRFDLMLEKGLTSFDALQFVFPRGTKVYGMEERFILGSEVTSTAYQKVMFTTFFMINCEVIKSNGESFFSAKHQFSIPFFSGIKTLDDLPVHKMTDEKLQMLTERGRKFNAWCTSPHYLNYKGPMLYKTRFYTNYWKADGRVMLDGNSFSKMNPEYTTYLSVNLNEYGVQEKNSGDIREIPADSWYKTYPTVGGFSFTTKNWGEISLDFLSEIKFDDEAFSRLVLPRERKRLIKALVVHSDNVFADVISGKGSGCIFLLHGPPGCGKTLTAEAIAELMHRPLYSISVGELGTDTQTLETKLRNILEVASAWNAVILMDEADIFLEKRSENDIKRNAMVGIFLRLLEYHQGVLFLTTNRVKSFDEAFHSRINVALKYDDLDVKGRTEVWQNFIQMAGLSDIPAEEMAQYQLNGRQIRNAIRLAQALAKDEGVIVTKEHVIETISIMSQFKTDLAQSETYSL